jgi:hypothetical protein
MSSFMHNGKQIVVGHKLLDNLEDNKLIEDMQYGS